jgi:hypothetical protein
LKVKVVTPFLEIRRERCGGHPTKEVSPMRNFSMQSRSVACLAALTLLLSQPALAQQADHSTAQPTGTTRNALIATSATSPAGKTPAVHAPEATEPDDSGDGDIKLHGHWVMTLKNADGSVAERREFENSLVTSGQYNNGAQLMVALLSGNAVATFPALAMVQTFGAGGTDATNACSATGNCMYLAVSNSPFASLPNAESGLSATGNFNTVPISLTLSGTFQQPAGSTATYTGVQSLFPVCVPNHFPFLTTLGQFTNSGSLGNANTGPNSCSLGGAFGGGAAGAGDSLLYTVLTSTTIAMSGVAAPVTLISGQSIVIVFTLTFS